jgi:hypothetical protein
MSSLCESQENSIIKTNHGDSIRDSELQTHQTLTDTMTDRKGISGSICHARVCVIADNLTTNQGSKAKRSAGGNVMTCRTRCIFCRPCRHQKMAMANRPPPMHPPARDHVQQTSLASIDLSALDQSTTHPSMQSVGI